MQLFGILFDMSLRQIGLLCCLMSRYGHCVVYWNTSFYNASMFVLWYIVHFKWKVLLKAFFNYFDYKWGSPNFGHLKKNTIFPSWKKGAIFTIFVLRCSLLQKKFLEMHTFAPMIKKLTKTISRSPPYLPLFSCSFVVPA